MRIDFGRWKGTAIDRLPLNYVAWLLEHWRGDRPESLRAELLRVFHRRIQTVLSLNGLENLLAPLPAAYRAANANGD